MLTNVGLNLLSIPKNVMGNSENYENCKKKFGEKN